MQGVGGAWSWKRPFVSLETEPVSEYEAELDTHWLMERDAAPQNTL